MVTRTQTVAPINHISVDGRGIAYITGSRLKVEHIVGAKDSWNMSPAQIQANYDFLTLGQVYAALSYYADHKAEIDAQIQEGYQYAEQMRLQNPSPMSREDFEKRIRERAGK